MRLRAFLNYKKRRIIFLRSIIIKDDYFCLVPQFSPFKSNSRIVRSLQIINFYYTLCPLSTLSGFKAQSSVVNIGYSHFATSAFKVEVKNSSSVKTISIRQLVITYHDSLAQLMSGLDSSLEMREVKNATISIFKTQAGTDMYFRTLVSQILCYYLMEFMSHNFPDLVLHEASDPLKSLVNTMRYFVNHVMDNKSAQKESIKYILEIMGHLRGGTVAKDIKSNTLLVPSAGVLKISGHKFLCLTPLREIQKLKDFSNFALICNYCMVVYLGIILENWNTFEKYYIPNKEGNGNLLNSIKADLVRLVLPDLLTHLGIIPSVIKKAQQLGSQRNTNPSERRHKVHIKNENKNN